ncbi:MAG: dTDP-4-dehydrorhamnose reductase [Chloroflexota bacterium]|nr:dTDP-4-dehydrorhamnose reductase [Chloroflexota bacterium]
MNEPLPSIQAPALPPSSLAGHTVVVTGAGGQLGGFLRPVLGTAGAGRVIGLDVRAGVGVDRVADITDASAVRSAIADVAPSVVIHAAAYTDVDGCERDPVLAQAVNTDGSRHVAAAARDGGSYLVAVSTDFVFSGEGGAPYGEDATPAPRSVYGATKLAGEQAVLSADAGFAVARTAWLYGGPGKHFPRTVLAVVRDRGGMEVVDDEAGSPTFAGDLAAALVALAATRGAGIFHLVNAGRATRFSLARVVAEEAGLDPALVQPTTTAAFLAKYPLPAQRPADSTLANTRAAALGIHLPPWRDAVAAYVPQLAAEMGLPGRNGPTT